MSFCLFLEFGGTRVAAADMSVGEHARLDALLATLHGLEQALVHTPTQTHDPFLDDGAPPRLALQLYFPVIADVEAAAGRASPLAALAAEFPALAGAAIVHEATAVRRYAVPDARISGSEWCTYLVAYDGPAEDANAWLEYYIANHPPLMAKMPGIREIEIYTAVDCVDLLPGERIRHLQRNKVVFDSPEALTDALESPVRAEMRAAYRSFPKFSGRVTHFPMITRRVAP